MNEIEFLKVSLYHYAETKIDITEIFWVFFVLFCFFVVFLLGGGGN